MHDGCDARRPSEEDAQRGGDEGMRLEGDDLRVGVSVPDGCVDVLRRQFSVVTGSMGGLADEDGQRGSLGMEEGPFGSDRGPQYPGVPYGGGSRSRKIGVKDVAYFPR